jgi:N-acetyl-gamma-glutamyl-phosphate reductase
MIHASIAGGDDALAGEILQILLYHPDVEVIGVCCPHLAGQAIDEVHHGMIGDTDLRFSSSIDFEKTNMVFVCTMQPDAFFAEIPDGVRIVDLTEAHINADDDYVYGFCELNRKPLVRGALHAAVPSPVAQAVLLALVPLANSLMINADVNIKVSADVTEQDLAEISAVINALQLSFTHALHADTEKLYGSRRALLAEISFDCNIEVTHIIEVFNSFYDDHNFAFVIGREPQAADVANTNKGILHIRREDDRLVISVAIDPLIKGAAGTAVHCMNLLFGLHERVGLTLKPAFC